MDEFSMRAIVVEECVPVYDAVEKARRVLGLKIRRMLTSDYYTVLEVEGAARDVEEVVRVFEEAGFETFRGSDATFLVRDCAILKITPGNISGYIILKMAE